MSVKYKNKPPVTYQLHTPKPRMAHIPYCSGFVFFLFTRFPSTIPTYRHLFYPHD